MVGIRSGKVTFCDIIIDAIYRAVKHGKPKTVGYSQGSKL
jgi:hypothetical protein